MNMADRTAPLLIIVGMPGAGKSIAAQHLRRQGWSVVYFGGITLKELDDRGLPHNQENERSVREDLRRRLGMDAYAKRCLDEILVSLKAGPTVVDGLYSWDEYRFLKANVPGPILAVAICAPRAVRYARLASRPVRPLRPEEAEARDIAEIEQLDKGGPIAMADYTVVNDRSPDDLRTALDAILRQHLLEVRAV
jgi:dephospho-CoA kinase